MKRSIIIQLLSVLCCIWCVQAQTVRLHWLPTATFTADSASVQALALEDGYYTRCRQLPSFETDLPHGGQVQLENVIYADLSADEQAVAQSYADIIPATPTYSQYSRTSRRQTTYRLELFPFVLRDGTIKKITAFDMQQNAAAHAPATVGGTAPKVRYAANSVLKNGKFVKIAVNQNGFYKLTYEELQNMGVNPRRVRIFGYGGAMLDEDFSKPYTDDLPEAAIYEYKGSDGVFGAGDYIIFYGQGPTSWRYDETGYFRHTQNVYSNYGYYFVTSDAGEGKRIELAPAATATPTDDVTTFTDYFVHEKDLVNFIQSGREFYGEEFNQDKRTYSFSHTLSNIVEQKASFRMLAAAKSATNGRIDVSVNNKEIGSLATPSMEGAVTYEYARTAVTTSPISFTPQAGNACNVSLTFSEKNGSAWLDYYEINLKRRLKLVGNAPFFFRNIDSIDTETARRFVVEGAGASTQIWDVTDKQNIVCIPTTYANGTLTFVDSVRTFKEYAAVNPAQNTFLSPTIIGTIPNQNLHALPQMDMVILAPAEFSSEAERLAAAHRSIQGLRVEVVDVEQVYNEFSSGTRDATAYRRLMKLFYDRAASEADMPRYLLLFGGGVYDNRKIIVKENYDKLLTFQSYNSVHGTDSYVCDDYFALLDDNEGQNIVAEMMDIGVGRFPVHTIEEARIIVDKTIGYLENKVKGEGKNQLLFVADDGDGILHTQSCDNVANLTLRNNPDMLGRKLYLDAYQQEVSASGESYPLVIELFDNYIKNGILMLNYMGHGGHTTWTNEGILTHDRIVNMYNEELPLFVTATCDFSRFDGNGTPSGGELLLLNNHGGAIALFTTTRTVYAEQNLQINLQFAKHIFMRDTTENGAIPLGFGDVMRLAKNARGADANKMNFTLLGDPALRLAYPATHQVITDSITLINADNTPCDTLKALSPIRIYGHIAKEGTDDIDDQFSGYVAINVFDKSESITTLSNDKPGGPRYTYTDRTNALFVGKSKVTDGRFTTEFIVPKDIRYNYGTGRIVYYAADTTNNLEANGYYERFIVGGANTDVPYDDNGPDIDMYLNTPDFRSGGETNESPLFVAHVSDEYGINAIGSGIGHDIMLKLDNNPLMETTLNNYYTNNMGEYQSGVVKYQFNNLDEGPHHLFFRVWDLQNNSATAELDFVVRKGLKPCVTEMYAYPNPASTSTTFVYRHDRPEQPLTFTATVADLAGRIVYTDSKTNYEYNNETEITWDFARQIMPGIYVVRMQVQVDGADSTSKTLKLMIMK